MADESEHICSTGKGGGGGMRAAMCTTVMRNGAGSRESNERQTCHLSWCGSMFGIVVSLWLLRRLPCGSTNNLQLEGEGGSRTGLLPHSLPMTPSAMMCSPASPRFLPFPSLPFPFLCHTRGQAHAHTLTHGYALGRFKNSEKRSFSACRFRRTFPSADEVLVLLTTTSTKAGPSH